MLTRGRGRRAKASDLTKEVGLWWGLLIIVKLWGWGLLNFIQLRMPSWIGSLKKDLVTSWLTIAFQGGLVTKDGGHCSAKDLWVFFNAHLQDGRGERNVVSIFILSTLIRMNNPSFTLLF